MFISSASENIVYIIIPTMEQDEKVPTMGQDEKDDYDLYWKASLKIYA